MAVAPMGLTPMFPVTAAGGTVEIPLFERITYVSAVLRFTATPVVPVFPPVGIPAPAEPPVPVEPPAPLPPVEAEPPAPLPPVAVEPPVAVVPPEPEEFPVPVAPPVPPGSPVPPVPCGPPHLIHSGPVLPVEPPASFGLTGLTTPQAPARENNKKTEGDRRSFDLIVMGTLFRVISWR